MEQNKWNTAVTALFLILGAGTGYYSLPKVWQLFIFQSTLLNHPIVNMLLGALIFFLVIVLLRPVYDRFLERLRIEIEKVSLSNILLYTLGIVAGLIVAWLVSLPISALNWPVISNILPILLSILFAYIGFMTIRLKGGDIKTFFSNMTLTRREVVESASQEEETQQAVQDDKPEELALLEPKDFTISFKPYKILDTSVIIDGRILDILKTGFIEGVVVVPNFVLKELQYIADSAASEKRVRGRRGLDVLNAMQDLDQITVEFYTGDFEEEEEVDLKLILLTKKLDGVLVTNDYNLNKVSQFHQIKVLNINELANAMKTVVVPGDHLSVRILKPGTERQQGVGYLNDGTMIVVEEGKHHMDEHLDVEVTSAIQTNAGKMIFAKIAE
ncbi:PIN/TRAM domain-containing protein [Aerococcus sp. UMB9870]|uniref:PIN/TRAM domain-containing protein n=1 Tax=Aerococcus sp. UMB9870 TaxID=3046351 RepID=UPI00254CE4AD|nr:PIN domain-containing protein [Aerococcus sp. UMB9870]MDK6369229.1 PIN domain nuclease [Aerococcus sp. UMB9870]